MRRILFFVLFAIFAAGLLVAADFWEEKPYPEWSQKDVAKMLTHSPWAKEVHISLRPMSLRAEAPTTMGGTRSTSNPETLKLVIRWESSLPIKQAQVAKRYGAEAADVDEAQQYLNRRETQYIVSVSGENFRPAGRSQGDAAAKALTGKAVLKVKDLGELRPDDVQVNSQGTFSIAIFTFPRDREITLTNKEVEFELDLDRYKVGRKFKLKDMVFKQRLEL